MTEPPAIEVLDVGIAYRQAINPAATLKEHMVRAAKRQVGYRRTWAVQDVTFSLMRGDQLGIIGHNGAGKTSLMRTIAGVLRPTRGRVIVRGHVTPVIDLTSGLNYDLTGRDNVRLIGALLGRDPRDVAKRVDAIADWAGLQNYIDQPVRTYSAGMVGRLAFSIVTDDRPDVLLVDEVLAIGDSDFAARSIERMESLRDTGATVVVISHDVALLEEHSSHMLWLDAGRQAEYGPPGATVAAYRAAAVHEALP